MSSYAVLLKALSAGTPTGGSGGDYVPIETVRERDRVALVDQSPLRHQHCTEPDLRKRGQASAISGSCSAPSGPVSR